MKKIHCLWIGWLCIAVQAENRASIFPADRVRIAATESQTIILEAPVTPAGTGSVFGNTCRNEPQHHRISTAVQTARREITDDLRNNILAFWVTHAPDPAGGFYGSLAYDGKPRPDSPKGGVLNARILWTFSSAYRLFGDPVYRQLADRAQQYFLAHFIDLEYGGTYWSLQADGTPQNTDKQTYGLSYAIYGLAEHYRATGTRESLDKAIEIFRTMEKNVYDPEYGGYIESFTRDWQKPDRYGYDGKGIAEKTMNTHLHVLEAYTGLYRVWPDTLLKQRLKELIDIAGHKILDRQTGHERLYFTRDWKSLENIDSYGHDIEFSWLLTEAAEVLGDPEIIRDTRQVALYVVDVQMKEGLNKEGAMRYEKDGNHIKEDLEWWPQAESVVGFLNAWLISGEKKYEQAFLRTWKWIGKYMIDREHGEWYGTVRADGTPVKHGLKASMWRCPYHNSRMGFEVYERLKPEP